MVSNLKQIQDYRKIQHHKKFNVLINRNNERPFLDCVKLSLTFQGAVLMTAYR